MGILEQKPADWEIILNTKVPEFLGKDYSNSKKLQVQTKMQLKLIRKMI